MLGAFNNFAGWKHFLCSMNTDGEHSVSIFPMSYMFRIISYILLHSYPLLGPFFIYICIYIYIYISEVWGSEHNREMVSFCVVLARAVSWPSRIQGPSFGLLAFPFPFCLAGLFLLPA